MKKETKEKLYEAWEYIMSDELDESIEWMVQYMQDYAEVDFNTVMEFLYSHKK